MVTFHNQRDYIFFRHHRQASASRPVYSCDIDSCLSPTIRYQFKNNHKVALQEIGPRFTLRLRWFQRRLFDTKAGHFDWMCKRDEKDANGKRIFSL